MSLMAVMEPSATMKDGSSSIVVSGAVLMIDQRLASCGCTGGCDEARKKEVEWEGAGELVYH